MNTTDNLDRALARIANGDALPPDAVAALAAAPDILSAGMLADAQRRAVQASRVSFLRVSVRDTKGPLDCEPGAQELRIDAGPDSLDDALELVGRARTAAGGRTVAAFSWSDVARWAASGRAEAHVLADLKRGGLDALAQVAIDTAPSLDGALEALSAAGFDRVRLHVAKSAPAEERARLWLEVARAQRAFGVVASLNPLPLVLSSFKPTTGYDDVKTVALARLAAVNVPHIQVDWRRYGPKLAQVALTFGADDIDGVSGSDEAPEGRRRAPLEEIRRNIVAAGFEPVERNGRFDLVGS